MNTQELTGKLARWPRAAEVRIHGRASGRSGRHERDCLSHYPLPSAAYAQLLDWTKGEVMAPATFLAMMVWMASPTETGLD